MKLVNKVNNQVLGNGVYGHTLESICEVLKLPVESYVLVPESSSETKTIIQNNVVSLFASTSNKDVAILSLLGTAADGGSISILLLSALLKAIDSLDSNSPLKLALKDVLVPIFKDSDAYNKLMLAFNEYATKVASGTSHVPILEKTSDLTNILSEIDVRNTVVVEAMRNVNK